MTRSFLTVVIPSITSFVYGLFNHALSSSEFNATRAIE